MPTFLILWLKNKNKHKKAESIIPQFYAHIMQNIPRVLKPYPLHLLRIFFLKMQAPCNIHLQYILCVWNMEIISVLMNYSKIYLQNPLHLFCFSSHTLSCRVLQGREGSRVHRDPLAFRWETTTNKNFTIVKHEHACLYEHVCFSGFARSAGPTWWFW